MPENLTHYDHLPARMLRNMSRTWKTDALSTLQIFVSSKYGRSGAMKPRADRDRGLLHYHRIFQSLQFVALHEPIYLASRAQQHDKHHCPQMTNFYMKRFLL